MQGLLNDLFTDFAGRFTYLVYRGERLASSQVRGEAGSVLHFK